jgi:hypothetical protein
MGGGNDPGMTALQNNQRVSMASAMTGSLQVSEEKYGLVTVNRVITDTQRQKRWHDMCIRHRRRRNEKTSS